VLGFFEVLRFGRIHTVKTAMLSNRFAYRRSTRLALPLVGNNEEYEAEIKSEKAIESLNHGFGSFPTENRIID
jgi:hypothetical protein